MVLAWGVRLKTYVVFPRLLFLLVAGDYDVNDILAVGTSSSCPRHLFRYVLRKFFLVNLSSARDRTPTHTLNFNDRLTS